MYICITNVEMIKRIRQEIKALKELKERHPGKEKLLDSLLEDYEEKLKEIQNKEKINNIP